MIINGCGRRARHTDLADPRRADREPDGTAVLMSGGALPAGGFVVSDVLLRRYDEPGGRCLITAEVRTDRGAIETAYDEGRLGAGALEAAAGLLAGRVGLAGVVGRSLLSLRAELGPGAAG